MASLAIAFILGGGAVPMLKPPPVALPVLFFALI